MCERNQRVRANIRNSTRFEQLDASGKAVLRKLAPVCARLRSMAIKKQNDKDVLVKGCETGLKELVSEGKIN